jgi:hypothetical protein
MHVLEDLESILEVLLLRKRETAPEGRRYLYSAAAVVLRLRSTRRTAPGDLECLHSVAVAVLRLRSTKTTASEGAY